MGRSAARVQDVLATWLPQQLRVLQGLLLQLQAESGEECPQVAFLVSGFAECVGYIAEGLPWWWGC